MLSCSEREAVTVISYYRHRKVGTQQRGVSGQMDRRHPHTDPQA